MLYLPEGTSMEINPRSNDSLTTGIASPARLATLTRFCCQSFNFGTSSPEVAYSEGKPSGISSWGQSSPRSSVTTAKPLPWLHLRFF
jgi:hypothetical protein